MGVYEITTESGAVFEIETEGSAAFEPATSQPASGRDITLGALKGTGKAALDIFTAPADLLTRGGNYLVNKVTGRDVDPTGMYPSDYVDKAFDFFSQGEGSETAEDVARVVGNLGTVIAVPSQAQNIASKIPLLGKAAASGSKTAALASKALGYGVEGAGYSALANAKSENLGEEMTEGAALNIAIPAALTTLGKAATGTANSFKEAARKLELSAFGANKTAIKKAMKRMPDVLDPSGKFQNPITEALADFQKAGGAKQGMSGEALRGSLESQYDDIVKKLSSELDEAQNLQKDVIIPVFSKTDDFVAQQAGTNEALARRIAESEKLKTLNKTDGTILSLQDEKVKLGKVIKDSAWGDDTAGQLRVNILKRVRADLRVAIEDNYAKLTGKPAANIKKLNSDLGKRESLFPLFDDMIATGEAASPTKTLLQSLRTSGGVGQILIAGSAGGAAGGPIGGAAAVAANMYLQTPQGKKALATALASKTAQNPLRALGAVGNITADALGKAASVGGGRAEDAPETQLKLAEVQLANATELAPEQAAAANEIEGEGDEEVTKANILWKPSSDSDGNLVILFPKKVGNIVIKDAETGKVLATGQATGPSNGYGDTVRFNKPGGSFKNVIVEDGNGAPLFVEDGSRRDENLAAKRGKKKSGDKKGGLSDEQKTKAGFLSPLPGEGLYGGKKKVKLPDDVTGGLLDAVKKVESNNGKYLRSDAGALGPYQFMPKTAKAYGLDDPFDEKAAREAALALLKDELDALGTVELALAAYNAGRPRVLEAIKKAGSKEFAKVAQYLPKETREYVPKIKQALKA